MASCAAYAAGRGLERFSVFLETFYPLIMAQTSWFLSNLLWFFSSEKRWHMPPGSAPGTISSYPMCSDECTALIQDKSAVQPRRLKSTPRVFFESSSLFVQRNCRMEYIWPKINSLNSGDPNLRQKWQRDPWKIVPRAQESGWVSFEKWLLSLQLGESSLFVGWVCFSGIIKNVIG